MENNKKPNRYSKEFKQEAINLVKSGERSRQEVAKNLGVSLATISLWCKDLNGDKESCKAKSHQEELRKLRQELERTKMERDILKKAATYFAKNLE